MNIRILDVRQGKVINPVSELHAKDVRIAELQDALEFSERVAAKLVDPYFPPMDKGSTLEFGHFFMPPADRLRCARIAVEEEMDNG